MKKFHIRIWWSEGPKEQMMVQHDGLTFDEICNIENHIEDIKHGKVKVKDLHKKLVDLKKKFESVPLTEYEGDYK
jgi:hypothetical protein